MKRFLTGIVAGMLVTTAGWAQTRLLPDDLLVTGPNFQQESAGEIYINAGGNRNQLSKWLGNAAYLNANNVFTGTQSFSGSVTLASGGSLSGTFSGNPTFSGTPTLQNGGSLNGTFSGSPTFSGTLTIANSFNFGTALGSGSFATVSTPSGVNISLAPSGSGYISANGLLAARGHTYIQDTTAAPGGVGASTKDLWLNSNSGNQMTLSGSQLYTPFVASLSLAGSSSALANYYYSFYNQNYLDTSAAANADVTLFTETAVGNNGGHVAFQAHLTYVNGVSNGGQSTAANLWFDTAYNAGGYLSSFTASANGTTLTVTGTVTGGPLQIGSYLNPSFGAPIATYISALGTGTGGAGTYTLNNNAGTIVSASTTALYAVGVGYAINPQCLLKTGATYWLGCEGGEIDISALAGTSPASVSGLVIAVVPSHASHGFLGTDSAIVIGGGSSVTGWDHGIRFGGANQVYSPFVTTASLLYVAHAMTVVNFMDFSLGTATANVLKASGGSIDGSFNILAPSVSNGSAGLTVALTGSKLGFYGATPIVKATPTGACAGNTGCQALRDALGAVGLINTGSITN